MIRALFGAPAALEALRPGRTGVVELVLSQGAYLAFGEDWVGLAGPRAPFGPLSLAVDGVPPLVPGNPARVEGTTLWLGEQPVSLERTRRRRCGTPTSITAAVAVPESPPGFLAAGLAALAAGRVGAAVDLLAGLGPGLTPTGDDVLAGYAAGTGTKLSALAAGRSSPLGLAYLRAAERGELPDACARLAWHEWGASSGLGFGWGLAAAFATRR